MWNSMILKNLCFSWLVILVSWSSKEEGMLPHYCQVGVEVQVLHLASTDTYGAEDVRVSVDGGGKPSYPPPLSRIIPS